MHLKRSSMPVTWPVHRKDSKKRYLAVPSHAKSKGISLLFLVRDILKLARTKKEVRFILLNKDIKINNIARTDESFPIQVFDTVSLEKSKTYYRLEIKNKKFKLVTITDKEVDKKVSKISGKTVLKEGFIQMNLDDGQNFVTKDNFSVGDSVIVNTKEKKIVKILPLKEGAKVEVIGGKHAGQKGKLVAFEKLSRGKTYLIKLEKKEVSLPLKTILVIE